MNYKMLFTTVLGFCSLDSVAADSISLYLSAEGIEASTKSATTKSVYVAKNNLKKLDPKTQQDADRLAKSIEFEVYAMGENTQFHTVFQSGGGVCYGYKASGVAVTDSSTYYKDSSKKEYYANIADGTVNAKGDVKDMQYASVFNIHTADDSKYLKEQEAKYGKALAERNLKDRTQTYLYNVCN